MANHPDSGNHTTYIPTSQRVQELQRRLDEAATEAIDHDSDVDERFDSMEAEIRTLRFFCLGFGILVLVETCVVVLMALGILRVGG